MSSASLCYICVDLSPCETVKFGFIIYYYSTVLHFIIYEFIF